jgi:uncharacterized protein YjbI with pentapeptide repeats
LSTYCHTRHRPTRARLARLYWLVTLFLLPISSLNAQVVINEIMYHPLEPWPDTQPYKTTNRTEFIEIYNAGTQSVDLALYRFDNGVSFTFDLGTTLNAGAYAVICQDLPSFTNAYPAVSNLLGEYNGTLRNGGERVTLSYRPAASWVEVDSISYLDDDEHDGTGKSMELIHPGFHPLRNHYYGDWSASTVAGGTPGAQNSVYKAAPLPVAGDIRHDPPLPFSGSSIEITTRVQGRDGHDVNEVLLEYRLDARADAPTAAIWTNVPMQDSGTDGDAIASNGVFTAMLPEFGAAPMQSGDIIEYRVKVTDGIGTMTFPATNRAGVLSGPFSLLVKFEDDNCVDCAYQDEYPTYHIIMSDANKTTLETRDKNSNVLLDGTLVTSDGSLFHNCGIRFRGKGSRNSLLGSYRIELPTGETYEDSTQLSLNQQHAMLQYLGMTAHALANDGYGSNVELSRVFLGAELKQPSHAIYVKMEAFSDEYAQRLHPDHDQLGNRYWTRQQTGFDGDLSFIDSNEVTYHSEYLSDINNPYTGYEDLLDVIIDIDQPIATYPTILSNHIDLAQWGGYFGIMAAIDNQEAGFGSPTGTKGDELKCYVRPDGKAELLPWDMDAVFGTQLNLYSWGTTTVPKFLLNPPMIHHYLGKAYDAGVNVLTDEAMNEILDDMGSKMAASKATYFNNTITRRGLIQAQILTNLTINGFAPGANAIAVATTNVGERVVAEPINQNLYNGEWVFLGSLTIHGTPLQRVVLTRKHPHFSAHTVADALMFSNAIHGITIIDDDDPGFSTVGPGWSTQASGGYNNGSYHSANSTPDITKATWSATNVTQAGLYDVYAWLDNGVDLFSRYDLEALTPGLSLSLSGTAPQNYTQRVLLNTQDATWDARNNQWTTATGTPVVLSGNVVPITLSAVDVDGNTTATIDFTAYTLENEILTNGVISGNVVWPAGTIHVTSDITIPAGTSLTIQPGANVIVDANADFIVAGQLTILGTADDRPVLLNADGTSAVVINSSGPTSMLTISNAVLYNANLTASNFATVTLTDASFIGSLLTPVAIDASGSSTVMIERCVFDTVSSLSFTSASVDITESLIKNVITTGISLSGAMPIARIAHTSVRDAYGSGSAIGIAVTTVSATLSNVCVSGMNGTGLSLNSTTSELVDSLFANNGTGISASLSSTSLVKNNTIADDLTRALSGDVILENNIMRGLNDPILNGPALASHSNIQQPYTNLYAGLNNHNRNPHFISVPDADYRLSAISPAAGTGTAGDDMGASFPSGANPPTPENLLFSSVTSSNITLVWSDTSADETGFRVERSADNKAWTLIGSTPPNEALYDDQNVLANDDYEYRVRAEHERGESFFVYSASTNTVINDNTQNLIAALRISELNYNPALPEPPSPYDDNDFEFIELVNIGATPLDLSGCYFANGITYTFPPATSLASGAFYILVRNPTAFAIRYPVTNIDGTFGSGGLSSGGERIRIKDVDGTTVLDFTYDDSNNPDWYSSTDGDGYTLIMTDFDGDPDAFTSWGASADIHGSPGTLEPAFAGAGIIISEVLAHTDLPLVDAVELQNTGTSTVDVAGWFLSDDEDNLKLFQIPALPAINIAPGGFHVFYEDVSFNQDTNSPNSFELSSLGDTIHVSSGIGTNLGNFRIRQKFDASENPVSFSRYPTSDGEIHFFPSGINTLGTSNSPARISSVVINEIMYNPGSGANEFIELLNRTGINVPLYDPANPLNTWRLDSAIDFAFPTGVTLQPNEHILITAISPSEFRTLYNIPGSTRIFGPYNGNMDNNGETLRLHRPDNPESNGFVPQILVDRVKFDNNSPWPEAANNEGPSLEKRWSESFGSEPTNWVASSTGGTPGLPNNVNATPTIGFPDIDSNDTETNEIKRIEVTISPASTSTVYVSFSVAGTATANQDYELEDNVLVFWPGDTVNYIDLTILNDNTPAGEPEETVIVTLGDVTGSARLGGNVTYIHTIIDNDATTLTAPTIVPGVTTVFTNTMQVTIQNNVPQSSIYYTTDGQLPTTKSTLYTGAITLTRSSRITARSYLGKKNQGAFSSVVFKEQTVPLGFVPPLPPPMAPLILHISHILNTSFSLSWGSAAPLLYNVYRSTNLVATPWPSATTLTNDMPATGTGTNTYTDVNPPDADAYYRIGVRNP